MHGFGGVVTCELKRHDASDLTERLGRLRLIRHANSFGGVESVIGRPFFVSHRKISEADRLQLGISPDMLRLSVGLEAIDDILADLTEMFRV
jgi:cystathionine beta-lyase/cystathionine gamma-synthase